VALAWNANAVAAVRAASVIDPPGTPARPLYQTEGLLYMSYVQAAVYDAAMKTGHRYLPYHRFSAAAGHASQFRAPAPPALTSALYTRDFNETKAYSSATSAVRTPAQTSTPVSGSVSTTATP
jgi:hypothetical protein